MKNQLVLLVNQVSERLDYTLDFIFKQHGLTICCTNDIKTFLEAEGDHLIYGANPIEGYSSIACSTLLCEESIRKDILIVKKEFFGEVILGIDDLVDPFAAIFYCLSRYEEYVNLKRDIHGRFRAKDAILVQLGLHKLQIVERWIDVLIKNYNPSQYDQLLENRKVVVIPSFDIDNTQAYLWKSGWRNIGSRLKDFIKQDKHRIVERKSVALGKLKDPYDTFQQITEIAERFPETRVFWLLGDYNTYDRNTNWKDPRLHRLIRNLNQRIHIGIHPSYASNNSERKLELEIQRLNQILGEETKESRQHFLKLNLPSTPRKLVRYGIKTDFSMGFADEIGFRAGTAHPFQYFDLTLNQKLEILTVPFFYMDGTFNDYLKTSPEAAIIEINALIHEIEKYGGAASFIWHNETIGDYKRWQGWNKVFVHTLNILEKHV